ncbi:MAG: kelch repeat-containing protein, partial [Cyanobacteria bacterium J06649_11]
MENNIYILILISLFYTACHDEGDLQNTSPDSFTLIGVTNGAVDVSLLPSFSWNAAIDMEDDEIIYSLILDKEPAPMTVVADNIEDTNYDLERRLSMHTVYYWKVIAEDEAGNMTESEIYSFRTRGLNFPPYVAINAPFSDRGDHASVVFDNKIWIIGGYKTNTGSTNDVWSSHDGVNWTQVTPNASFSKRSAHQVVVYNDKMWLIGGNQQLGITYNGDIWSSLDGITWTLEVERAPFNPFNRRAHHKVVVFNDKMWLIGGVNSFPLNDIWSSSDGVNWTQIDANAPFSARWGHTVTVFDNKLWVISGYRYNPEGADIWHSSDGITWTESTSVAPFSKRDRHTTVVFDNKMWVMGGLDPDPDFDPFTYSSVFHDDIWYSSDGINWDLDDDYTPFSKRFSHTVVSFNDKLWLIGGQGTGGYLNDIW